MNEPEKRKKPLKDEVEEWLSKEGYGLEFLTADIFSKHDFRVHQGYYVRGEQSQIPREIDVVAQQTISIDGLLPNKHANIRFEYVVECKWSRDKPWVVFSSPNHRMAPSACITQSIASLTGASVLWTLAGDKTLQKLDTFSVPHRPGYGGRQAFSKGNDVFYASMQSITLAASRRAKAYDHPITHDLRQTLDWTTVVLPVIVIDGQIFETYFSEQTNQMAIEEVKHIRIHWRGSESSSHIVTVDLVTLEELDNFVKRRRREIDIAFNKMQTCLEKIQNCYVEKSLASLEVTKGSRGILGFPFVLDRIRQIEEEAKLRSDQGLN